MVALVQNDGITGGVVDHIRRARREIRRFWDLLEQTFDCYITWEHLPLEETVPLLRQLIDMSWRDRRFDRLRAPVLSLLYYAWDRAREVQVLRARLQKAEAEKLELVRRLTCPTHYERDTLHWYAEGRMSQTDKRRILRALAAVGQQLSWADERLRTKLATAGLTPEMTCFLIHLHRKAEDERRKQRAKREERERGSQERRRAREAYKTQPCRRHSLPSSKPSERKRGSWRWRLLTPATRD
jgi:hypothetical protein